MALKNLLAVAVLAGSIGAFAGGVQAATSNITNGSTTLVLPLSDSGNPSGVYTDYDIAGSFGASGYAKYHFTTNLGPGATGIGTSGSAILDIGGAGIGDVTGTWYDGIVSDPSNPGSADILGDVLADKVTSGSGVTFYTFSVDSDFDVTYPTQTFVLHWTGGSSSADGSLQFKFADGPAAPVPEIDASAGMGSLAALGAMLAFYRSRRRSV